MEKISKFLLILLKAASAVPIVTVTLKGLSSEI